MSIVDPLQALRAALLADPTVSLVLGTRVYVERVPGAAVDVMPAQPGVMLRAAGGSAVPPHAPLLGLRIDVHTYGPTPESAMLAHWLMHDALRRVERLTVAGTLLHSVLPETGPMSVADPNTEWPEVVSSWALLAAEEVPA